MTISVTIQDVQRKYLDKKDFKVGPDGIEVVINDNYQYQFVKIRYETNYFFVFANMLPIVI